MRSKLFVITRPKVKWLLFLPCSSSSTYVLAVLLQSHVFLLQTHLLTPGSMHYHVAYDRNLRKHFQCKIDDLRSCNECEKPTQMLRRKSPLREATNWLFKFAWNVPELNVGAPKRIQPEWDLNLRSNPVLLSLGHALCESWIWCPCHINSELSVSCPLNFWYDKLNASLVFTFGCTRFQLFVRHVWVKVVYFTLHFCLYLFMLLFFYPFLLVTKEVKLSFHWKLYLM